MSIPEEPTKLTFGQELIGEIAKPKISDAEEVLAVKGRLAEHAGRVYQMLQGGENLGSERFQLAWMALCNDFQTLVHDAHTELGALEKLKLQHVILDITDDLKEAVLDRMEEEQETSGSQGWGAWLISGAAKTAVYAKSLVFGAKQEERMIPLQEMLSMLTGYQEAMRNPELTISLTNVKKLIAEVLEEHGDHELGQEIRGMEVKDLVRFLLKVPEFEEMHLKRKAEAEARLAEFEARQGGLKAYIADSIESIQKAAREKAEVIARAAHEYAMEKKDEAVKSCAQGFTPQALFGDKTFKETVEELVGEILRSNNLDYSLIRRAASNAAEVYRENLSENLGLLRDERNMARLGVKMTDELTGVARALKNLPEDASPEDMIRALGYGEMTLQQFREMKDGQISGNIARMITKDAVRPRDDQTKKIARGFWAKIKRGFINFIHRFQRKTAKRLLANYVPSTWLVEGLPEKLKSGKGIAETLGYGRQFANLEASSDVVLLHLFSKLTEEIGEIAGEGRKLIHEGKEANVSEYPDANLANQDFRRKVTELAQEIRLFEANREGGLLQEGLFDLISLFGDVAAKQGTGDSLFDVTTPAFSVLQPAWMNWLAA